ncbi:hypothetical protein CRM22_002475 [Opisthorchis felineus]|uniref:Uncharacterized protein n=1 Tax=Opisthorchis felineus TaxID=147828 RepID=A0A4V3SGC1_OPIFE|nr:hypothetical protein CRM22_002475 [Opisthorchis felineus]
MKIIFFHDQIRMFVRRVDNVICVVYVLCAPEMPVLNPTSIFEKTSLCFINFYSNRTYISQQVDFSISSYGKRLRKRLRLLVMISAINFADEDYSSFTNSDYSRMVIHDMLYIP